MMIERTLTAVFLGTLSIAACGDEGAHDHDHDTDARDATSSGEIEDSTSGRPDFGSGDGTATDDDLVTVTDRGGGVRRAVIVATGADQWVQVALGAGELVTDETGWDLAFQRIIIRSAHPIATVDLAFEAVTQAPAEGWVEDGEEPAFDALGGWWDYDPTNHTVSPKARTFFVAVDADTYFKLAVRDYYDDAGSSGLITFDYAPVEPPPVVEPTTISVKPGERLDLATGIVGTDAATGDLGVVGSVMLATSATGGARLAPETWDAVTSTDTVGFAGDSEQPIPGPPGSGTLVANPILSGWYDYDPVTHAVSPKDVVFVVRARDGHYFKVQVARYDAATGLSLRVQAIARTPADHTVEVTAPGGGPWVYTSLRTAMSVLVTDPTSDPGWDLGFMGAAIRTNGGTSGGGDGGAALLGEGALGDFTALAGAVTVDAELANAGPPGSGTHSGNAVLEAFYDYDQATHTLTVKPQVFVVALADGTRARVKITSYASGAYTLSYTYAGSGYDAL